LLVLDGLRGWRKAPGAAVTPDRVKVLPLTPVTRPEAKAKAKDSPPGNRRAPEGGANEGRLPLALVPPPKSRNPPGRPNPPPATPPGAHDPVGEAVVTVMLRAAMVVFDDFDGVPLTVTQSPAATLLTGSLTVRENVVVGVQLTVVWPELTFCTSMLEPDSAATLPEAPPKSDDLVAAPAAVPVTREAATATTPAPAPARRGQLRRLVLWLIGVSMSVWSPLPLLVPIVGLSGGLGAARHVRARHSVRSASMGARWAARLAG
jgi:hypothetical protein